LRNGFRHFSRLDRTMTRTIDIHQHLWPPALIDALRRRREPPRLDGWTLHLAGEPPFPVHPPDHDPQSRRASEAGRIVLGLSSPLGIEDLPPDQARPLLEAWHDGARELRTEFDAWAAVNRYDADPATLKDQLTDGFVGLQIPATWLERPADVDRLGEILQLVQDADRPIFVHPGSAAGRPGQPAWWAAVVEYPAQLQAAWWSWQAAGRAGFPHLRVCFAAGAGLAPAQHERFQARAGRPFVVDPQTFVETSSYGRQGVDALTRALGVDPIVVGSDRPYGAPYDTDLGQALRVAFTQTNPHRLLTGDRP
jgi:hypothetical protein